MKHSVTWSGMCLAIWLVRTGVVMVSFLKAKYDPTNTSGVDTPNHRIVSSSSVVNGAYRK